MLQPRPAASAARPSAVAERRVGRILGLTPRQARDYADLWTDDAVYAHEHEPAEGARTCIDLILEPCRKCFDLVQIRVIPTTLDEKYIPSLRLRRERHRPLFLLAAFRRRVSMEPGKGGHERPRLDLARATRILRQADFDLYPVLLRCPHDHRLRVAHPIAGHVRNIVASLDRMKSELHANRIRSALLLAGGEVPAAHPFTAGRRSRDDAEPMALEEQPAARRRPLLMLAGDGDRAHRLLVAIDHIRRKPLREQQLAVLRSPVTAERRHACTILLEPHRQHDMTIWQPKLKNRPAHVPLVKALHENGDGRPHRVVEPRGGGFPKAYRGALAVGVALRRFHRMRIIDQ